MLKFLKCRYKSGCELVLGNETNLLLLTNLTLYLKGNKSDALLLFPEEHLATHVGIIAAAFLEVAHARLLCVGVEYFQLVLFLDQNVREVVVVEGREEDEVDKSSFGYIKRGLLWVALISDIKQGEFVIFEDEQYEAVVDFLHLVDRAIIDETLRPEPEMVIFFELSLLHTLLLTGAKVAPGMREVAQACVSLVVWRL